MHEALIEGRKALPACLPNPPVGCVVVLQDRIVAGGFTQPPGSPHAEAAALNALSGHDFSQAIVYVTLEPCSFHGRTPSCAMALVARGVKCVTIATLDSDPRDAGAGVALLNECGIETTVGILEREALADIGDYLWGTKKASNCWAVSSPKRND